MTVKSRVRTVRPQFPGCLRRGEKREPPSGTAMKRAAQIENSVVRVRTRLTFPIRTRFPSP
jgi:hypothetical protein